MMLFQHDFVHYIYNMFLFAMRASARVSCVWCAVILLKRREHYECKKGEKWFQISMYIRLMMKYRFCCGAPISGEQWTSRHYISIVTYSEALVYNIWKRFSNGMRHICVVRNVRYTRKKNWFNICKRPKYTKHDTQPLHTHTILVRFCRPRSSSNFMTDEIAY